MQKTHRRKDARRDWKRDNDVCGGGLSVVAQVYKRGTAGEQSQAWATQQDASHKTSNKQTNKTPKGQRGGPRV